MMSNAPLSGATACFFHWDPIAVDDVISAANFNTTYEQFSQRLFAPAKFVRDLRSMLSGALQVRSTGLHLMVPER